MGEKKARKGQPTLAVRLAAKPPDVVVVVVFEWDLVSPIREAEFDFSDVAAAVEFVRCVVSEGFWLRGRGTDAGYTFIPSWRVLSVRAPEPVAAAMSERAVPA